MKLVFVNEGGPASLIRSTDTLNFEQPAELPPSASAALLCWQSRPGEIVTVSGPDGSCWRCRVESLRDDAATIVPFESLPRPVESPIAITVYHALPEKERFELVLQKLTELGVTRVVPMLTERSATLDEWDAAQEIPHRWSQAVLKAAKQCRRAMIPELAELIAWNTALADTAQSDTRLMLCEGETNWSLQEVFERNRPIKVALMIGPEGGFSPEEVAQAEQQGILPIALGPRILRAETAAIAAVTGIQYAVGDLATG